MGESLTHRGGGRRSILTGIAVVAALAGILALVVAFRGQDAPPTPPASAAGTVDGSTPTTPGDTTQGKAKTSTPKVGGATQHPLPVSTPQQIDIPALDVHSSVITVGKNPDGTLEVPQPGPNIDKAAWYENSASPGRPGPSVIIGHVDTTAGRSIFFNLGDLRPGDKVRVTRADNTLVTFVVDGVRDYPQKSDFPTQLVYGGDLSRPNLRLVTCSNFDQETGHYVGNLVVFAHMTGARKA